MIKYSVDKDISKAKTILKDVYTSNYLFELLKQKIFENSWHFIGQENLVKNIGSCLPFTLLEGYLDEPLLLTKNNKGKLNCLSNVCTHRGNLVVAESCNLHQLKCGYHGRCFDLDGKFKGMPEFKEVKNFPTKKDNLTQLPIYNWKNLLFTNLNNKYGANLFFKDMVARINWLPIDEFIFSKEKSKEYFVDANWALYVENYLEGFHVPFVHEGLNAEIDFTNYTTELFYPFSSLQIGVGRTNQNCFEIPKNSEDYGKNISAYYFWVFPNLMFNFYPWGLSINIVKPISVNKTQISYLTYIWKNELLNVGAGGDLDKVELEDEVIVKSVQKGIRSKFYKHGRYSVTREKGTHHFHRLLSKFINSK
ncbi:MAG: aromatic ring-hydroxylating dioxygenase subunit alpha [Bacteroidetes bacterium]|nr:aromatic ring-hydroxylating dioxygenase subunit alpha [Bacteroidota bacterium]